MVELVLVAQGVYSSRGQLFPVEGDVAKVISLYCELLSSEGAMETALQYLKDSSGVSTILYYTFTDIINHYYICL